MRVTLSDGFLGPLNLWRPLIGYKDESALSSFKDLSILIGSKDESGPAKHPAGLALPS